MRCEVKVEERKTLNNLQSDLSNGSIFSEYVIYFLCCYFEG